MKKAVRHANSLFFDHKDRTWLSSIKTIFKFASKRKRINYELRDKRPPGREI